MKILFYCGHPAHYHLVKNVEMLLKQKRYDTFYAIKSKDILEKLLLDDNHEYYSISSLNSSNLFGKYYDSIVRIIKHIIFIKKNNFDLLVGTSWENSVVTKIFKIPSICLNEDDANVVPSFSKNAYPNASSILTPDVCNNGKFESKSIKYSGYHELSYLHPNHFQPNFNVVKKYNFTKNNYFIIRFAKLNAHHDKGIRGINDKIAIKLVELLNRYGEVIITSEKKIISELEPYRINIVPTDMHHVLAYAKIYIGDSQTMAAEAGVLGTPFIRFNDFVGKIGYLNELENKYKLGFGFKTDQTEEMFNKIKGLLNTSNLKEEWKKRRQKMLADKIDVTAFMVWFIENYPKSVHIMKNNPGFQYNFK